MMTTDLGERSNVQPVTETQPDKNWNRLAMFLPLLVAAAIYLPSTASRAVIDYDEGHYAQAAQQMVLRGDYVTTYVNGVRFLEKPPLMYWMTAASFWVFGINEFALRLPTALAVLALVWVVTLTARRGAGERAALIAGLCTACSAGTYLFTRETLHDVWLVLFIALAMYAFLEWYLSEQHSLPHALLFYAALAGAILCKGLVGVAFPVGAVVVFYLASGEWPKWRALHLLPGSLLFLVLAAPWHVLAALRNQGFLWFFFVNEQFLRFLGKHDPPVLWSLPLFTFWALTLVWFFPWTAFLPAAYAAIRKPAEPSQRALTRLALIWAGVIMLFFSVSGRLEHYVFPALPALSILVAMSLSRTGESRSIRWGFRGLAVLGVLIMVGAVAAAVWFIAGGRGIETAPEVRSGMVYQTDYSILADMPASIMRILVKPAVITIASLAIGFLIALRFERKDRRMPAVISVAIVMAIICGMIHWSLVICEDMISSKKFAQAVAREAQPGDHLVVVGDYESANSMNFYEPLRVEVFDGVAYALVPGMKYPDAPRIILSAEDFERLWESGDRVYVLAPKARLGELRLRGTELLEVLDRVLLRNH